MSQSTFVVAVENPDFLLLRRLVQSLVDQTITDWNAILVTREGDTYSLGACDDLRTDFPQLGHAIQGTRESWPMLINRLRPQFGTWWIQLHQHDFLPNNVLAQLQEGFAQDDCAAIYGDEEHVSPAGLVSQRTSKGAWDPVLIRHHRYVGQAIWLRTSLSELDLTLTVDPVQGYLLGLASDKAVRYLPAPLIQHFRAHELPLPVRHPDSEAGHKWLRQTGLLGTTAPAQGVLRYRIQSSDLPHSSVLLLLDSERNQAQQQMEMLGRVLLPGVQSVHAIYRGEVSEDADHLRGVAKSQGFKFQAHYGLPLGEAIHAGVLARDTDWTAVLMGMPINRDWLFELLTQVCYNPGRLAAVGSRIFRGRFLTQPGTIGWKYAGWDWNTRGRFNRLLCPHQVSYLSAGSWLVNTRAFRQLGGFDPQLPELFAMDLGLRFAREGYQQVWTPWSQAMVHQPEVVIPSTELTQIQGRFPNWQDPHRLHQF